MENHDTLDRFTPQGAHVVLQAEQIATIGSVYEWRPRHGGRPVGCRIESWRERAERLEKELEALRRQNALDAIDKRRESERG
jgi:hypothetical protein